MPSPFPGMDPYLEDPVYWPDIHQRLATYIGDGLSRLIKPNYYAHIGERVYIGQPPDFIIPDTTVVETSRRMAAVSGRSRESAAVSPLLENDRALGDQPEVVYAPSLTYREPFVKIVDARHGEKVVAIIEILSPSNKIYNSIGHRQYREKLGQVLNSDSHLVEIDLLRAGYPTIALPPDTIPPPRPWDYVVSVNRASDRQRFEIYSRSIRERLPRVSIPLSEPDPDVVLDLQEIINQCYENGAYQQLIDYTLDPPTPLREADREWARPL